MQEYYISTFPRTDLDEQRAKVLMISDAQGEVVARIRLGHAQGAALGAALKGHGKDVVLSPGGTVSNRVLTRIPDGTEAPDLCRCATPRPVDADGRVVCSRCRMVTA